MNRNRIIFFVCVSSALILAGCNRPAAKGQESDARIPVIFDTDANNELDDQHALAYLLLNDSVFRTIGVTVNATWNGGAVGKHVKEAERIVQLCGLKGTIPVLTGANEGFPEIRGQINDPRFDGYQAVDFIIREALKERDRTLTVIAVGKLTNMALALLKEPSVAERIRLVWLGSNYPDPGEYNQMNDTAAMSFVLGTPVPFEMVTVRYGKPSGTAEVTVTQQEIFERMPGLGPETEEPVTGRHGGTFTRFGDYSVSLFSHAEFSGENRSRALFDMAAVAIVKDPSWARASRIPCPVYLDDVWKQQPGNQRTITVWEDFNRDLIIADFFATFH
jgi:purine nucleosidase